MSGCCFLFPAFIKVLQEWNMLKYSSKLPRNYRARADLCSISSFLPIASYLRLLRSDNHGPCWITAAKLSITVFLKLSITFSLWNLEYFPSYWLLISVLKSNPLLAKSILYFPTLSVPGKLRSPLYSVTNHSNQVEALLTAATALTQVINDHLVTKSEGCFSGFTSLDFRSTWHYGPLLHSWNIFFPCLLWYQASVFLFTCLLISLEVPLCVPYLKHVGIWSKSSIFLFSPKFFWGHINHFLGIVMYTQI